MKTKNSGAHIAKQVEAQGLRVERTRHGFRALSRDGQTIVSWHLSPAIQNRGYANLGRTSRASAW